MDVSKIDYNFLEIFSSAYETARSVFVVEPTDASVRNKKRIRKWIRKTYIDGVPFPEPVMRSIDKDVSDEAFIDFLKACHDQVQTQGTHQKQLFDKFSAELPMDVKSALWSLFELETYFNIHQIGTDAQIVLEYGEGYERILTLKNATCLPAEDTSLTFENGSLIRRNEQYVLVGTAENWEEDTSVPFAIHFTDAAVKVTVFRADAAFFSNTPWQHLTCIASTILDKCFLPGEYLNAQEKAILPLIVQISKLSYWARIPAEYQDDGFSELKAYIKKYADPKPMKLLEALEAACGNPKKKARLMDELMAMLNKKAYEPLWRELYRLLADSQSAYPTNASISCFPEMLHKTRTDIQHHMQANGYSGTYPDFVKHGAINSIHLAQSYGMSYFVGFEKNVAYHIHCTEVFFNDHLAVEFLCGTQILRKNEAPGDIYSCLFHAGGHSFFQAFSYGGGFRDESVETNEEHLATLVRIAAKKAELKKLTKEEHAELEELYISWWSLFLSVFVIMGGLFGVFMTAGMFVVCALVILLSVGPAMILEGLAAVPWWQLFLFSWVSFGSAMGIVTVLAQRK